MGTKNPKAKYVLPDEVHPVGLKCYQILIPDEPHYIAAFRGALLAYASAISWSDDPDHTAKEVGKVLAPLIEAVTECGDMGLSDVRQNTETPCILEKKIDGDWEPFADLTLCKGLVGWPQIPGGDSERMTGNTTPPWPDGSVPPGQSAECLSAANATEFLRNLVNQILANIEAAAAIVTIVLTVGSILAVIFTGGGLAPFIIPFVTALITLGADGIRDNFTAEFWHELQCILNCHADSHGSYTTDQYNNILFDIDHKSGVAWPIIRLAVVLMGPVGLTRTGNIAGVTASDCTDCGCNWCIHVDLTLATIPSWLRIIYGAHVTGQGIQAADSPYGDRLALLEVDTTPSVRYFFIDQGWDVASTGNSPHWQITATTGGSWFELASGGVGTGIGGNHWAGDGTYSGIAIGMFTGSYPPGGDGYIKYITLRGTGVQPFGESNC